jgi:hypothetical protein
LQTKNPEGPDAVAVALNSNLRSPGAKEDAMIEANVQRLNEQDWEESNWTTKTKKKWLTYRSYETLAINSTSDVTRYSVLDLVRGGKGPCGLQWDRPH